MTRPFPIRCRTAFSLAAVLLLSPMVSSTEPTPSFNQDILPILSENCFACHGPDANERQAGLRLDQREGAIKAADSGTVAIVPTDSAGSELYRRLVTDDANEIMPPPDSGKSLTAQQITMLQAWIDDGAPWQGHWSFNPPTKPTPPPEFSSPGHTAIDQFILARLQTVGLAPEEPAVKETLIRRVTLDLTGLPPTINEIDDFLADEAAEAYQRVVDRLLKSSRYGEHMARIWLDAARYADTHGLHLDNERSIWPYRDWVIDAFNRNQPFDEFTVQQLAGDLLDSPTQDQRLATGFNRCNVTTSEGGSIDDEYYMRYAVDRVETTATVWLGLTAGCAACHDHKFDPLSQKEFYQLYAYFYSLTEKAMDGNVQLPPPVMKVPSDEQAARQSELNTSLTAVRAEIQTALDQLQYTDPTPDAVLGELAESEYEWFDDAIPAGAAPQGNEGADSWQLVTASDGPVFSGEQSYVRKATGLSQHFFTGATDKLVLAENDRLFAYVYLDADNPPETVQLQFNDGSWEHRAFWGADKAHGSGRNNSSNLRIGDLPEVGKWVRLEVAAEDVGFQAGSELNGWACTQFGGKTYWDKAGRVSTAPLTDQQAASLQLWQQYRARVKSPGLPEAIQKALDTPVDQRSDEQHKQVLQHYAQSINPTLKQAFAGPRQQETELTKQLAELDAAIPATLVMEDRAEPRQAFVLKRGEYTQPGEPVSPRVPDWIMPAAEDLPPNRLGLAKWLVSDANPLTARVTVNRFWQQFFGTGLVKTSEDFGVQGERPSHPELLDWLATEFIESGWDVKQILKQIVTSSTYRQSSRVSPDKLSADPENRWLARGPRFRLDAEVIRDQALAVSGLLNETIGGQSVKPYQPAGLWAPVGFGGSNTAKFVQDSGDKLYRRSMYTFWKRTSPPPSMSTFDAPNRETCSVRRARTNTPLQALVLLNDVQFIEAARKLAEQILQDGGGEDAQRIGFAFRRILSRRPTTNETQAVIRLLSQQRTEFASTAGAAAKLLAAGEAPLNQTIDANELASWTLIAHLLLNLSETVTKG